MTTTLTQTPETLSLEPGQTLRTPLEAGAWLQVTQGRARLVTPPGWFGETVFMAERPMGEGDGYRCEKGGWVEVHALTAVRLVCVQRQAAALPARPAMRLVQLLTGW